MDTMILVLLLVGLAANGLFFTIGLWWILSHTRHTVDSVIALKLATGGSTDFHSALSSLKSSGLVPDVEDVVDAGAEQAIPHAVKVRGPEGEPETVVELVGTGFFDDPVIVNGRVKKEWEVDDERT